MVGSFEVMQEMSRRNLDIRLSPLGNIEQMSLTHKGKDTRLTIGVFGNVIKAITFGELVGGLFLCDAKQFEEIKAELEAAAKAKSELEEAQRG